MARNSPNPENLLLFTTVPPTRRQSGGWTEDAQRAFIGDLARHGVVAVAARSVGLSKRSAYMLRKRPGAESFAQAWDGAVEMGRDAVCAATLAAAKGPLDTPLIRRGKVIGVTRGYNLRLMLAALRSIDAARLRAAPAPSWPPTAKNWPKW